MVKNMPLLLPFLVYSDERGKTQGSLFHFENRCQPPQIREWTEKKNAGLRLGTKNHPGWRGGQREDTTGTQEETAGD